MLRLKNILVVYIVHIFLLSNATELTISQPGMYLLGDAITSSPAAADNIINITSSDVVLDLGGYVISQANGTANVAGIVINPNLSDIVIRNGTIRSVTGTGLVLTSTDARIRISNILFENCASAGMTADGSAGSITDIELTDCRFYGCSSTGNNVILWSNVSRSSIGNSIIAGTANTTSLNCIKLTCSQCRFNSITIQNISSTGNLNGVSVDAASVNNNYSNVIFTNCSGGSGSLTFFNGFDSNDSNSIFSNCSVIGNTSFGSASCFSLGGNNCVLTQCRAISNILTSNNSISGFFIAGSNNILLDCIANNIRATTAASVNGYLFLTSTILGRCIASNANSSGTGSGLVASPNLTRSIIFDSLFSRNTGSTGNGVSDAVNATGDLYYRNVAFNNSTAQFSGTGFPQTVPASPATQFLNAITQPWTNLAVPA
ncbi:MAG TPA: hypothetical protein VHO47_00480 [Candidatus Babeliales bacterium]|nr:hypothetical protein [Candidatus Babeliales bacterium]